MFYFCQDDTVARGPGKSIGAQGGTVIGSVALAVIQAALLLLLLHFWPWNWSIYIPLSDKWLLWAVIESLPVSLCHGPGRDCLSLHLLSTLDSL